MSNHSRIQEVYHKTKVPKGHKKIPLEVVEAILDNNFEIVD